MDVSQVPQEWTDEIRENENQEIEWHLWPLVMSGVPSDAICIIYVWPDPFLGERYRGISINGEMVIDAER